MPCEPRATLVASCTSPTRTIEASGWYIAAAASRSWALKARASQRLQSSGDGAPIAFLLSGRRSGSGGGPKGREVGNQDPALSCRSRPDLCVPALQREIEGEVDVHRRHGRNEHRPRPAEERRVRNTE